MEPHTARQDTRLGHVIYLLSPHIDVRFLIAALVAAVAIFVGVLPGDCSSDETLAVPVGQQSWVYDHVDVPVVSGIPDEARPLGIGPLASDTSFLTVHVKLPQFTGPVDIYGAYSHASSPNLVFNLQPDLSFTPVTVEEVNDTLSVGIPPPGVEPWLREVIAPLDESPLKIRISVLPPGHYALYLLVTPSGSLKTFYLWITSFEVRPRKVGLTVSFPGKTEHVTPELVRHTYDIVRTAGFTISHMYYSWGEIEKRRGEYDWSDIDFAMQAVREQQLKASLVLKIIDTNRIGSLPEDVPMAHFQDRSFKDRAREFFFNLLRRHHDTVQYLWIGNEIDGFFHTRRDHLEGYIDFYRDLCGYIRSAYPHVKVGTVFSYHDARRNGVLDLIQKVGVIGDILGFSLYPQIMTNEEDKNVKVILREMSAIARSAGRRYAITETGWSTEGLGGSEEAQSRYLRSVLRSYQERDEWMEFLGIFMLYDFPEDSNRELAAAYGLGSHADFLRFQGSLGIADSDGYPKKGWDAVMEEMREFNSSASR